MQVTLTPHGEELLREALARNPGRSPEEVIEQALAERTTRRVASTQADLVWERLKYTGCQITASLALTI